MGLIVACKPSFNARFNRNVKSQCQFRKVGMMLNPRGQGIERDLIANGIREPYMTKYVMNYIQPSWVVLDLGANQGYYALKEARKCRKVYAVEPIRSTVAKLQKNIELNGLTNMEVYQMAIGDHDGTAFMNISDSSNLCSVEHSNDVRTYKGRDIVQMATLDSFLKGKERPNLIRMDVEGYEYEILQGETVASGPLSLCIEMHFDILGYCKAKALLERLKGYGFQVKVVTVEPHPAIMGTWAAGIAKRLDKGLGLATGEHCIGWDELLSQKFLSGQIEFAEVLFERK